MKTLTVAFAGTLLTTTLIGCSYQYLGIKSEPIAMSKAVGEIAERVTLEQGWSTDTRNKFWFTGQGSQIMPYRWFMWLEQPDNEQLFRDSAHMEALRYLPMAASRNNIGGLPIGFALHQNQKSGTAWVGMTCAACHTNQIDYNDTKILVEGAPTLANFVKFFEKLNLSMARTLSETSKFERFAKKVLQQQYSPATAVTLKEEMKQVALMMSNRQAVNELPADYPEDFTSYGRLDAFGNIQNAGTAFALHDLTNKNFPTGPVSYPFLWGTHQSDVVQWNASAPNTPIIGPLVRNIGEVVGVFGGLDIKKAPWFQRLIGKKVRYSSTVDIMGLGKLESWVKTLRSPQWPEQYLPAIDDVKSAQGEAVYAAQCASCHQVIARDKELEHYTANQTLISELGTDPTTSNNASCHMAKTLILQGTKERILIGDTFQVTDNAIDIPVNGVVGLVLKDIPLALKAGNIAERTDDQGHKISLLKEFGHLISQHIKSRSKRADAAEIDCKDGTYDAGVYKGRPLNGIWATAPYLHNGSVPNLYQLLQKPQLRVDQFWVGSREFNPVTVGFKSSAGLSEFRVKAQDGSIMAGNSNLGHRYGTDLSNDQKWQLIEYMKTL